MGNVSLSYTNFNNASLKEVFNNGNFSNKNKNGKVKARSTVTFLQTLKVKLFAQKLLAQSLMGRFNKL